MSKKRQELVELIDKFERRKDSPMFDQSPAVKEQVLKKLEELKSQLKEMDEQDTSDSKVSSDSNTVASEKKAKNEPKVKKATYKTKKEKPKKEPISDSKKEEDIPDCDELLKKYKERKKKSKIASQRARDKKPVTVGDIVKRVSDKAVAKIEKSEGKTTRSDRAKILVAFKNIIEEMTLEDRRSFISEVIAEIKPLIRKK